MIAATQTDVRRRKTYELADRAFNQFAQFLDDHAVDRDDEVQRLARVYLTQLADDLAELTPGQKEGSTDAR